MLNQLRKLRYKLISNGKLKKYIAYALGEIILIFIGITLAIAFENFRENQKARTIELLLLKEMLNDEERNVYDLKQNLEDYNNAVKGCNYILDKIENKKPNDDAGNGNN